MLALLSNLEFYYTSLGHAAYGIREIAEKAEYYEALENEECESWKRRRTQVDDDVNTDLNLEQLL